MRFDIKFSPPQLGDLGEERWGQDKDAQQKSGRCKMFWGVFQDVWGLEQKMCFFVEVPEAEKQWVLLVFLQCFIAFN